MKFWLNTIFLGTFVSAGIDVNLRRDSNLAPMMYSDMGAVFEGRILESISNYSNPFDDFVPSKSMKFVDSIYKNKRPPLSLNYKEFVAPFITSSVILTAMGFLALMTLGFALLCRGRPNKPGEKPNYCRCLPMIAEDMPVVEKMSKLKYYRRKWLLLFNVFTGCTILVDVLSFIGYLDITKGEVVKVKWLKCTDITG